MISTEGIMPPRKRGKKEGFFFKEEYYNASQFLNRKVRAIATRVGSGSSGDSGGNTSSETLPLLKGGGHQRIYPLPEPPRGRVFGSMACGAPCCCGD